MNSRLILNVFRAAQNQNDEINVLKHFNLIRTISMSVHHHCTFHPSIDYMFNWKIKNKPFANRLKYKNFNRIEWPFSLLFTLNTNVHFHNIIERSTHTSVAVFLYYFCINCILVKLPFTHGINIIYHIHMSKKGIEYARTRVWISAIMDFPQLTALIVRIIFFSFFFSMHRKMVIYSWIYSEFKYNCW